MTSKRVGPSNSWVVITGGPSSGKTTLINELAKQGYRVVHEAARQLIDDSLAQGVDVLTLRADEKKFQEKINWLKLQTEMALPKEQTIFFDRGVHDSLAYMRYYNYQIPAQQVQAIADSGYRKVFLLEPLANFTEDYARTEDADFLFRIPALLRKAYEEGGMEVITLPDMPVNDRVKFILANLG